jgi:hypothetical protein
MKITDTVALMATTIVDTGTAKIWIKPYLSKWACQIAGRFSSPVYLVGSALTKEYPRDIDVVVILSDEDFFNRYGLKAIETQVVGDTVDEKYRRYWEDVAKLTRWASMNHNLNIDFKIQDVSSVRLTGLDSEEKLRLDCLDLKDK